MTSVLNERNETTTLSIEEMQVRQHLHGLPPLTARLEPWMIATLRDRSLFNWVDQFSSPLNLVNPDALSENVAALRRQADDRGVNLRVFFARKSNKCLALVDAARSIGIGIDTASHAEIDQTLARGVEPSGMICTAAIKDDAMIDRCLATEPPIVIAVDNFDELDLVVQRSQACGKKAKIALRLGGFHHGDQKLPTRFGFDVDRDLHVLDRLAELPMEVCGLHFHLDGYDAKQRVSAMRTCLKCWDRLQQLGHHPTFIDMGGGFPISYLPSGDEWATFWSTLRSALLNQSEPITYDNHGIGLSVHDGQIIGRPNSYPYHQSPVFDQWFADILDAPMEDVTMEGEDVTLADAIRRRGIELRCEPGRSLVDGCGMTVARVEFRKQSANGDWLIGLAMNRTQCRTTSDDFLVDPILVPQDADRPMDDSASMEGYLVGAYCMESELLSLRRLRFPSGVQRGDLVIFPNTAGYFMHFLESRSHQFPLAQNLVLDSADSTFRLDDIDR